jgi:hypothetical protein
MNAEFLPQYGSTMRQYAPCGAVGGCHVTEDGDRRRLPTFVLGFDGK